MNIVYNCDDNFVRHAAVSILSLFDSSSTSDSIDVFILDNGISPGGRAGLEKLLPDNCGRRSITFIKLDNFEEKVRQCIGGDFSTCRFSATALARLFAPEYLPEHVKRYIYLDSDTVVAGDIKGLWELELAGNIAGLVPEPTIYPKMRERLGLKENEPYFNSGVMLVDREAWRSAGITSECMRYYAQSSGNLPFPDQDLINLSLRGRVLPVSPEYDFFSNWHYESYSALVKYSPWYAAVTDSAQFEAAAANPLVIHFAGAERPWFAGNFNPYRSMYRRCLERTVWKGTPETEGRRLYLLAYHMMNLITGVAPGVRRVISGYFYDRTIAR